MWLGRDQQALSTARRYETLAAKGFDASRLCSECGRVEHRETCSHHRGTHSSRRDADMIIAGLAGLENWVITPPEPQPPPQEVVSFVRAPGTMSYNVTLSCGHVVVRRKVPRAIYCRVCRRA